MGTKVLAGICSTLLLMALTMPETNTVDAAKERQTSNFMNISAEDAVISVRKKMDGRYKKKVKEINVKNLKAHSISVISAKVEWTADEGREYKVDVTPVGEADKYADNIYIDCQGNNMCYINGLRENSEYRIRVTPLLMENEDKNHTKINPITTTIKTEKVEVIYDGYEHIDGWTQCFAGERASGLTIDPSWSAIQGSTPDPITGTGIRRDEYGDYCCAMGVYFGYCGDRFLIELENGVQFTVKICDSKGYGDDGEGKYHWFGGEGVGKCVIEFIYDDNCLPNDVAFSGSWGYYNWKGLNFDNIKSIKKINYGKTIDY